MAIQFTSSRIEPSWKIMIIIRPKEEEGGNARGDLCIDPVEYSLFLIGGCDR